MRRSFDGLVISITESNTLLRIVHEGATEHTLELTVGFASVSTETGTRNICLFVREGQDRESIILEGVGWQHVLAQLEDFFRSVGKIRKQECVLMFRRQVLDTIMEREEALAEKEDDRTYKLICAADKCRSEIVLCLMGKPGIGKTEAVERFARDHGRNVVHIIASQVMPNEVSGMTMPNQETHSMDVFDHYRLSHMRDGDILFMDELLKGQQQVLNACLTMIQERRLMSGTKLPDVLIIAAANPLASPKMLPLEIRQRFMFVTVNWRRDKWVDYMVDKQGFMRTPMLDKVSRMVEDRMSRDDQWNTLTPRAMTKIMLWMRKLRSEDFSVSTFLFNDYGMSSDDVEMIRAAAIGHKDDDLYRVAFKINDIVGMTDHDDGVDDLRHEVTSEIGKILRGEDLDFREVIEKLMQLPEWKEIEDELRKTPLFAEGETDDIKY